MSTLTNNQWVERVSEIRQMVSDVNEAPTNEKDIEYYIRQEFELTDPDEIRIAEQEFKRQYGI